MICVKITYSHAQVQFRSFPSILNQYRISHAPLDNLEITQSTISRLSRGASDILYWISIDGNSVNNTKTQINIYTIDLFQWKKSLLLKTMQVFFIFCTTLYIQHSILIARYVHDRDICFEKWEKNSFFIIVFIYIYIL